MQKVRVRVLPERAGRQEYAKEKRAVPVRECPFLYTEATASLITAPEEGLEPPNPVINSQRNTTLNHYLESCLHRGNGRRRHIFRWTK